MPFILIAHISWTEEQNPIDAFSIVFYSLLIYGLFYAFVIFFKKIINQVPIINLTNLQKFIIFISFYILLFYYKFYVTICITLFSLIFTFIKSFFLENVASKSLVTFVKELDNDDVIITNHFKDDLPLFDLSKQVIPLLVIVTIIIPGWNNYMMLETIGQTNSYSYIFILFSYLIYVLMWLIIQTVLANLFIIYFLNMPVIHPTIKTCLVCLAGGGGISCVGWFGATSPHHLPLPDWAIIKSAQLSTHGFTYSHGLVKLHFNMVAGLHPQLLEETHKVCYPGTKTLSPELLRAYNITESAKFAKEVAKQVVLGEKKPIPVVVDAEFFEKEQASLRDLQAALDAEKARIENAKNKFESESVFKK